MPHTQAPSANKPSASSASSSASASSASTPSIHVAPASRSASEQRSASGKGGGKGGKGSTVAAITPLSASDNAHSAASMWKKAFTDNSEKYDTDDQEKVDGLLCVNTINLARRMIVKGMLT